MSATELDESQKKFIQAAGISNADFLKLKEAYEKERDESGTDASGEHRQPEVYGLTETLENGEDHPMEQEQSLERYLPTKQSTKEILEIAKEQGDELDGRSLKMLDDVLYSEMAPRGGTVADVKQAATVAKGLADLGKLLFKKYASHLGIFGAVAGLLKDLLTYAEPEKKDPVLKEIGILRNELDVLSSKITAHFDELKGYMSGEAFFTQYADDARALLEHMVGTMICAKNEEMKEAQEDFVELYKKVNPEYLVTKMLIMLERDSSNPLIRNMKGAEMPTLTVFNKWRDIIDTTLTQFLILEEFASGLLHPGNVRKQNIIVEKITRFHTMVDNYGKVLEGEKPDFKKLRSFVRRIQEDGSYATEEAKAIAISTVLNDLYREDRYQVVVLHKDVFYTYKVPKPDQLLISKDCGSFDVFVFWVADRIYLSSDKLLGVFKNEKQLTSIEISIFRTFDGFMKDWLPSNINKLAQKIDQYGFFFAAASYKVATRSSGRLRSSLISVAMMNHQLRLGNFGWKYYDLFYFICTP